MNAVRLVFDYPHLAAYESEEREDAVDPEYARLAGALPFDGTLEYTIYAPLHPESSSTGDEAEDSR
jgi:hypothetical protein